jgi:CBS domain-containing protein
VTTAVSLGVLLVKWFIWAVSLGSGTSGGVLAPLLMMGGALGGLEAMFLPNEGAGFWPLISMGAILGGTMRSPFTSIIFAFELTHDANVFLPLLVGSVIAHAFTVLTLKRSILTEKVARRGFHLTREYSIDPLELLYVREVMRVKIVALPAENQIPDVLHSLNTKHRQSQRLLPVVNAQGKFLGVITRGELRERLEAERPGLADEAAGTDCEAASGGSASKQKTENFVIKNKRKRRDQNAGGGRRHAQLLGLISLDDLLKARTRHLEEERRREQVFKFGNYFSGGSRGEGAPAGEASNGISL